MAGSSVLDMAAAKQRAQTLVTELLPALSVLVSMQEAVASGTLSFKEMLKNLSDMPRVNPRKI